MKKTINLTVIIVVIFFLFVIGYLAINSNNRDLAIYKPVPGNNPAQYPGPVPTLSALDAYPGVIVDEPSSEPTTESSLCSKTGSWISYENTEFDYALNYPPEAELSEYSDGVTVKLNSTCHDTSCVHTRDEVSLRIFSNSSELNLHDFIVEEFRLDTYPPMTNSIENLENSITLQVAGEQALRVEDGITLAFPDVFIARQGLVFWFFVPQDPPLAGRNTPCHQTLETFEAIISDFSFTTSTP